MAATNQGRTLVACLGAEMLYEVRQTHFRGNIGEALLKLYLAQTSAERQES